MYTLALDLEGTLISGCVSGWPRPGLASFLERCDALRSAGMVSRLLIFTAAHIEPARRVIRLLAEEGSVPAWFGEIEVIEADIPSADGSICKDLRQIPGIDLARTLFVDDMARLIHPTQVECWVPIAEWERPYDQDDTELARVADVLEVLLEAATR